MNDGDRQRVSAGLVGFGATGGAVGSRTLRHGLSLIPIQAPYHVYAAAMECEAYTCTGWFLRHLYRTHMAVDTE